MIKIPGLPAEGQSGAQIDAQVHGVQMGHGVAPGVGRQGSPVWTEDPQVHAYLPIGFGGGLVAVEGGKAPGLSQPLQQADFLLQTVGHIFVIALGGSLVGTGAGE